MSSSLKSIIIDPVSCSSVTLTIRSSKSKTSSKFFPINKFGFRPINFPAASFINVILPAISVAITPSDMFDKTELSLRCSFSVFAIECFKRSFRSLNVSARWLISSVPYTFTFCEKSPRAIVCACRRISIIGFVIVRATKIPSKAETDMAKIDPLKKISLIFCS